MGHTNQTFVILPNSRRSAKRQQRQVSWLARHSPHALPVHWTVDFMVRLRLQLREQLRDFTGFPIQPILGTFVAVSLYMVLNFYIITKSCSFTIDQFEFRRKDFLALPAESEKGSSRWHVFRRNLSISSYFLIHDFSNIAVSVKIVKV